MESPPTLLEASGCLAWITSDGEDRAVYKIERSTTAWGGEKVEGYIRSTAGSRFEVGVENFSERSVGAPDVEGDILFDGTCMGHSSPLVSFSFRSHICDQGQSGCNVKQNRPFIAKGRAGFFFLFDFLC
jgi:hypothetical protein